MQLVYFINIFENSHNIVRNLFVTDSVNVMKNRLLVSNNYREISVYINLAQSHQKTMETFSRSNSTQNFHKPWKLDDLEKYWTSATNNL